MYSIYVSVEVLTHTHINLCDFSRSNVAPATVLWHQPRGFDSQKPINANLPQTMESIHESFPGAECDTVASWWCPKDAGELPTIVTVVTDYHQVVPQLFNDKHDRS